MPEAEGKRMLGAYAAILWQRHGLPMEVFRDILREKGMDLDLQAYQEAMERHRRRSGYR